MNILPVIQSVDRALQILDLFDEYERELKITEISERLNLHKSTVHSLLKTLRLHRYIEQNPENGKYRLGLKLFERGNYVVHAIDLGTLTKPYLYSLAKQTMQTVHLVTLDEKEGVYIDKVEGGLTSSSVYSRIGRRVPIHCSAVGKALVAHKSPSELNLILTNYKFSRQTDFTITNKEVFLKELVDVRKQGYSVDDQKNELGVYCIAVPIHNYTNEVVAAISISSPIMRFTVKEREKQIELLKENAKSLSTELGYGYR